MFICASKVSNTLQCREINLCLNRKLKYKQEKNIL